MFQQTLLTGALSPSLAPRDESLHDSSGLQLPVCYFTGKADLDSPVSVEYFCNSIVSDLCTKMELEQKHAPLKKNSTTVFIQICKNYDAGCGYEAKREREKR